VVIRLTISRDDDPGMTSKRLFALLVLSALVSVASLYAGWKWGAVPQHP
jgi:hypothetical protein